MSLAATAALLVLAQGTPVDVAFDAMVANNNASAIEQIERTGGADRHDPASLINLGIAYAREGREAEARKMFALAASSDSRVNLETASGEWIDSRALARRALAMLERGEFAPESRVTMR